MDLIPESINGDNTQALDQTFLDRLVSLGVKQLSIDFIQETDPVKLSLWLEQFGIPVELLPGNLDALTLRDLLPLTIKIYNLSGTDTSIRLLALALGASEAQIIRNIFSLSYNHEARYDGLFQHKRGEEYQSFAIDVKLHGVSRKQSFSYEASFRKLFNLFEPVNLHLNNVIIEISESVLVSEDGKVLLFEDGIHAIDLS